MISDPLGIIIYIVQPVAVVGFYYGVIKTKLDGIRDIKQSLGTLTEHTMQSRIGEGQQTLINKNLEEKVELLNDRVDVHDIAIKNLEISMARHSGNGD